MGEEENLSTGFTSQNYQFTKHGAVKQVERFSSKNVEDTSNNKKMNRSCSEVPARLVLYFLSWSGFLVSFMMRNDINFALVAMVKSSNATNGTSVINASSTNTSGDKYAEFDWDQTTVSWILSSFYWMYVLSQVAGGITTQYFGTKAVFGWSQLVTALCSLCIPISAVTSWKLVILMRSIQGFASGLTWPAMYSIVGSWYPPSERSRFMSSFQGFSFGIGLTYPLCGFIIHNFGWRQVFYTTGCIGVIWCVIWYFLAFNTPAEHPRISQQELEYIEMNVSSEMKENQNRKIPWKSIFTSMPAWSIGITTFGRIWVHYTFIMNGPSFMKNILNFDIQINGIISGLPFIGSYFSSVLFCYVADLLVRNEVFTLSNIRKIMTASSQIIPGVLTLLVGYMGDEIIGVIIVWSIAIVLITAAYAGAMACIVDLSPNFAGPVLAFAQTIHMSASFLSPLLNGAILQNPHDISQWRTCFLVSCIVSIVTYIVFQIYGTADVQKWNYVRESTDDAEKEILDQSMSSKMQQCDHHNVKNGNLIT